jgi:hypothetical protein
MKAKEGEIFKVQLSIATDHSKRRTLIYNKDRSKGGEFDADKAIIDFMAGDLKAYVVGWRDEKTGKLNIVRKCEAQPW